MDKDSVRSVVADVAALLALKGESDPARIRAQQDTARVELRETGRSTTLDELHEQVPPGLVEMLRIPGLGVAKVRQIHELLHIESLLELEEAIADGRVAALPRFGSRTAENVRRGITALR